MTRGIAIFQLNYSTRMLGCWCMRNPPPRWGAACVSCNSSPGVRRGSRVLGGGRCVGAACTSRFPPAPCLRAARTASPCCWNLRRSSCRWIMSSSVSTRTATTEPHCCAPSVSWALRL